MLLVGIGILPHKHEIAIVGDEDPTISVEVPQHLFAVSDTPDVFTGSFNFDDTASRNLGNGLFGGGCFLQLVCCEESTIRDASAAIFDVDNTLHSGFEGLANLVEEVG